MKDHHATAKQALKENLIHYLKPSSYKVDHRLKDVNGLYELREDYDLFLLDRDCTLHEYHGKKPEPAFKETLRLIASKSEIISNSSYDEFLKIRDVFGDVLPISKLVRFGANETPHIIRFANNRLNIIGFNPQKPLDPLTDCTSLYLQGDELIVPITYNYKKPNPLTVTSVVYMNQMFGRVSPSASVLMVGDRYLTDIVAGNLAKSTHFTVDTARVTPFKPLSDKPDLILTRYLLDSPIGGLMSRLNRNNLSL